jgi:hypothetical protein
MFDITVPPFELRLNGRMQNITPKQFGENDNGPTTAPSTQSAGKHRLGTAHANCRWLHFPTTVTPPSSLWTDWSQAVTGPRFRVFFQGFSARDLPLTDAAKARDTFRIAVVFAVPFTEQPFNAIRLDGAQRREGEARNGGNNLYLQSQPE